MFSQPSKALHSMALECGVRYYTIKVGRLPTGKREDKAGKNQISSFLGLCPLYHKAADFTRRKAIIFQRNPLLGG